MRGRIIDSLYNRMAEDPSLFFVTADMGINLVERFEESYPDRYANVGIAEQNLIGVGAGLCNAGFRPFLYTISNFLIQRCFEQIRNDIALHEYPAVLLGTSAGFDNAPLGPTHHIIDDWGPLAAIPGIDIYCPSSVDYADSLVDRLIARGRPAYVRISKGQPNAPGGDADATLVLAAKPKILLVSYGTPVQACLELFNSRSDVSVAILNRLRPLDEDVLLDALTRHEQIITVEDHRPESGLYSALCRFCIERQLLLPIKPLGVSPGYMLDVGSSDRYYHKAHRIDAEGILQTLKDLATAC